MEEDKYLKRQRIYKAIMLVIVTTFLTFIMTTLYITNKSSILMNFTYQDTDEYLEGNKHQIISNVLLPENTKITIIDTLC